jgi:predicted transcriptional regulator
MENEHNQYDSEAIVLAAEIVASYVAHNSVQPTNWLISFITSIQH